MGFKRLLADADPDTAARAAVRMARATARRAHLPPAMREQANNLLDVGVDELAARIRDTREGQPAKRLTAGKGGGPAPTSAAPAGVTEPAASGATDDVGTEHLLPAVPVEDNIVVQITEPQKSGPSLSGLVFPGTPTDGKPREGTVVAVGPGRWDEDGEKRIPLDVNEGDIVIYSKYGGTEIEYTGAEYLILSAHDVLAVVNDVPLPKLQGGGHRVVLEEGSPSPAPPPGTRKR